MMNAAVDRASENELLISLVRGHRSLWDQASQDYRNASLRNVSWIAVAKALGLSGTNDKVLKISRRWRNLRDTFAKKLRDSRKKSGAAAGEPTSTWKHFNDMLFLRDILEPRQTTTNMEIFRDDSAEEILSQYSESPSEILLPMVEGRHTDTTHTNTINSLPSTPSGLSGSASHSSSPRSFPSLPSPQTVSTAFSLNTPTSSLEKTPKTKRKKDSRDRLLENINNELHIPMSNNEHFLLSLKDQLDKVPDNLLGLCKIHILDILNHYEARIVPTNLVPLKPPQGKETILSANVVHLFMLVACVIYLVHLNKGSLYYGSTSRSSV
ncbi:transcription factor Adf-1-like [Dermacentor silvarum]|uniref:transcription factor Adf-1-like n=1 Tax=Dermacentor silvarum TaxID=543639 RepID=UPI0021015B83|nr:transcription factor Adf-1-like [Dermacentor silvarum]